MDFGWKKMVQQLVDGNEAVCRTHRHALHTAEKVGDQPKAVAGAREKRLDVAFAFGVIGLFNQIFFTLEGAAPNGATSWVRSMR